MSKEERSIYTDTGNHLQSIILIFLGFLLFVSFFIFFPYYPLVDLYNALVKVGTLSNQTNDNLEAVKLIVLKYPQYQINNQRIENSTTTYKEKLVNLTEEFENSTFSSIKESTLSTDPKTYTLCIETNISNWDEWRKCNENQYLMDLQNEARVTIDSTTTARIKNLVQVINKSVDEIRDKNTNYKLLRESDLDNMASNFSKWQNEVYKASYNNEINMSFTTLQKVFFKDTALVIPNAFEKNKKVLEDKIKNFNEDIKQLSFPIVGQVPFNLTQVLLSFPIVIIIGFSYISLQIKKLIIVHRKLGLDKKVDKIFLSWIDPIQEMPERIYSILVIILPAFLFGLYLIIIYSIWYTDTQYIENYSILSNDLTYGTFNTRDSVMMLNYISIGVLGYCYYEIGKAWFGKQKIPDAQ